MFRVKVSVLLAVKVDQTAVAEASKWATKGEDKHLEINRKVFVFPNP